MMNDPRAFRRTITRNIKKYGRLVLIHAGDRSFMTRAIIEPISLNRVTTARKANFLPIGFDDDSTYKILLPAGVLPDDVERPLVFQYHDRYFVETLGDVMDIADVDLFSVHMAIPCENPNTVS